MDKTEAIEELGYDIIASNPYDLFEAVGARTDVKSPKVVFNDKKTDKYDKYLNEFSNWLGKYTELTETDGLSVSDVFVTDARDYCAHSVIHMVNGLNGCTQVSSQSLKHIMDIVSHLEDYYGARAWISSVHMHSDVFYYTISFVIWGDTVNNLDKYWNEDRDKREYESEWFGNLKPLSHRR
jgi:hypothetical protein